jgi:hypothetical protein
MEAFERFFLLAGGGRPIRMAASPVGRKISFKLLFMGKYLREEKSHFPANPMPNTKKNIRLSPGKRAKGWAPP